MTVFARSYGVYQTPIILSKIDHFYYYEVMYSSEDDVSNVYNIKPSNIQEILFIYQGQTVECDVVEMLRKALLCCMEIFMDAKLLHSITKHSTEHIYLFCLATCKTSSIFILKLFLKVLICCLYNIMSTLK